MSRYTFETISLSVFVVVIDDDVVVVVLTMKTDANGRFVFVSTFCLSH